MVKRDDVAIGATPMPERREVGVMMQTDEGSSVVGFFTVADVDEIIAQLKAARDEAAGEAG